MTMGQRGLDDGCVARGGDVRGPAHEGSLSVELHSFDSSEILLQHG